MTQSVNGFHLTYTLDPMQVEGQNVEVRVDDDVHVRTQPTQCGRKRVRDPDSWKVKHVKRTGLRRNAPKISIEEVLEKDCCKKSCLRHFSAEHLEALRQHLTTTYDEQNLYITGLMIRSVVKRRFSSRMALLNAGLKLSERRCLWGQLYLNLTVEGSTVIDLRKYLKIFMKRLGCT